MSHCEGQAISLLLVSLLLLQRGLCVDVDYEQLMRDGLLANATDGVSSLSESLLETRASSESPEPPLVEDDDDRDDAESVSFLPSQSAQPPLPPPNASEISASTLQKMQMLTELFNNASHSALASEGLLSGRKSTLFFVASSTSSEMQEPGERVTSILEEEGVGSPKTLVPLPKSIFQKSIDWMGDAYTLSILVPIAAGVLFAATIIVSIAFCRCVRRRCRRKRMRRKVLPDSVKNMRPSDRARLLAESSDEEF